MGVNMFLIEDQDGLTLIDTSVASSVKGVLQDIGRLGRQPTDLKRVLITHAHPDHIGGLPELKRITGAEVIASELERPVIEGKIDRPGAPALVRLVAKLMMKPAPVDRGVQDCELVETFGGMQALLTPGHAPGHLCFWQPEKKVLVAGDVMFNLVSLTLPPTFLSVDMDEDRRSRSEEHTSELQSPTNLVCRLLL